MEIRTLTTFLKVAETQSFTQAAALLGYSQSAVTIQIRQLEKELQVQLFDRIGKQVSLTDKGRQL
ncbi:MAG: LysR family transcriptional regulator, partial [Firmicutes bacterium]|nr:LysR family transcriptional regulator [Bacillota bacterium]